MTDEEARALKQYRAAWAEIITRQEAGTKRFTFETWGAIKEELRVYLAGLSEDERTKLAAAINEAAPGLKGTEAFAKSVLETATLQ